MIKIYANENGSAMVTDCTTKSIFTDEMDSLFSALSSITPPQSWHTAMFWIPKVIYFANIYDSGIPVVGELVAGTNDMPEESMVAKIEGVVTIF